MDYTLLARRTGVVISKILSRSPEIRRTASLTLHRQSIKGLLNTRRGCAGATPQRLQPTAAAARRWLLSSVAGRSTPRSSISSKTTSAAPNSATAALSAGAAVAKNGTSSKPVAIWLFGTAGAVAVMVTVGGITRMTRSGLSMTDWKIQGSLPPSSQVMIHLFGFRLAGRTTSQNELDNDHVDY